jgi:hypothetical protein
MLRPKTAPAKPLHSLKESKSDSMLPQLKQGTSGQIGGSSAATTHNTNKKKTAFQDSLTKKTTNSKTTIITSVNDSTIQANLQELNTVDIDNHTKQKKGFLSFFDQQMKARDNQIAGFLMKVLYLRDGYYGLVL